MTDMKNPVRALLVVGLLLTGVRCKKDALFVYSRLGGDALLPCTNLVSPDCSFISWTFYKGGQVQYTTEVSRGQVSEDSDKANRMSVTSNCSLSFCDLKVNDAGSYVCLLRDKSVINVYLSLVTITTFSSIADLQPGGNLTLNCILFTYYDAGSCKSYSSNVFNLSWVSEDGSQLTKDSRLTGHSRCNITLVTKLQKEDNNRKWRCQVSTTESSRAAFVDFTSSFLFQIPPTAQIQSPESGRAECSVHLPVSRIVLCVALPVMVLIVGFFTWRGDRKRAKTSAAGIELQEFS